MRIDAPPAEEGFILVTAVWLLILGGALASLLLLHALTLSTRTSDDEQRIAAQLSAQAAVETVLADILFRGMRSKWSDSPAQGTVRIGSREVLVEVTSESGRLDINEALPETIEGALRGFNVPAAVRKRVLAAVTLLRSRQRRVGSFAELEALLTQPPFPDGTCLADFFTFDSGLAEPTAAHLSPPLVQALARGAGRAKLVSAGPAPHPPNAALRFRVTGAGGAEITAVARLSGRLEAPILVSGWSATRPCMG